MGIINGKMVKARREGRETALKASAANVTPKPATKTGKAAGGGSKSKKQGQRTFRLTPDSLAILEAIKERKPQHGLTQEEFISAAIIDSGKKLLGDDFPALRNAPAEFVPDRLERLEHHVFAQAWQRFDRKQAIRARNIVRDLGFEPHSINMEKVRAWGKENGKTSLPTREELVTATYAVRFGFDLPPKDSEE